MAHAEHPRHLLLEHRVEERLPSVEDAPILEAYASLGSEQFQQQFALETPLYKNGTVNHRQLVKAVTNLLRPGYQWEAPFFDEHHLYWPAADYELPNIMYGGKEDTELHEKGGNGIRHYEASVVEYIQDDRKRSTLSEEQIVVDRLFSELIDFTDLEEFDDPTKEYFAIAAQFRELAMNKLWVPRQFHSFTHAVTKPPEMPELAVMKRIVRNARRREYLFQVATSAITIREKLDRAEPLALPSGTTVLLDRKDRRIYHSPLDLEQRREAFIRELIQYHNEGSIDLTRLAPIEVVDGRSVEQSLSLIALRLAHSDLVKTRHNNRAWRVELQTRPRPHSVWLRDDGVENAA